MKRKETSVLLRDVSTEISLLQAEHAKIMWVYSSSLAVLCYTWSVSGEVEQSELCSALYTEGSAPLNLSGHVCVKVSVKVK